MSANSTTLLNKLYTLPQSLQKLPSSQALERKLKMKNTNTASLCTSDCSRELREGEAKLPCDLREALLDIESHNLKEKYRKLLTELWSSCGMKMSAGSRQSTRKTQRQRSKQTRQARGGKQSRQSRQSRAKQQRA